MLDLIAYWPLVLAAVSVLVALVLLDRHERVLREMQAILASESERNAQQERDFYALLCCSRNLVDKMREHGEKQLSLLQHVRTLEAHDDGKLAVTQAARLMDKGVAIEEISELCELTQGELDLLVKFSKHRKVA